MTPNQFELHAGSANKRPPEYIYLDNGSTLREVLNTCKAAPLERMEEAILKAIGSSYKEKPACCLKCKGELCMLYRVLNLHDILICFLIT